MALTHLHCMLDIALSLCAPCVSAHKSEGTLRGLCCKLCLQCSNCRAAQVHKLHKLHTHPQTSADCWHAHCTFGQRTSAYGIGDAGCHCLPCRRTETADVKGVQSKPMSLLQDDQAALHANLYACVSTDADHVCMVWSKANLQYSQIIFQHACLTARLDTVGTSVCML